MKEHSGKGKIKIAAGALLLTVGLGAVLCMALFRDLLFGEGKPVVYHFPESFSGWVIIKFEVPTCDPLQEDGNAIHVRIGKGGEACTSSRLFGWKKATYIQAAADGTEKILTYDARDKAKNRIWPVSLGHVNYTKAGINYSVARELLFVGTQSQYESAWSTRPSLE